LDCEYHYWITNDPQEVVKYSTRLDVLAALHKLLAKQAADGFTTRLELSGRYHSSHPDGRTTEFWIDDTYGDIVASSRSGSVLPGLEIDCPAPSTAHHGQSS
jgi:hypothetical protein